MDQPLKVLRQFRKNLGRTVDVVLYSGVKRTGVLIYADEKMIKLEEKVKLESAEQTTQAEIPFVQIKSTQVVINFKF